MQHRQPPVLPCVRSMQHRQPPVLPCVWGTHAAQTASVLPCVWETCSTYSLPFSRGCERQCSTYYPEDHGGHGGGRGVYPPYYPGR